METPKDKVKEPFSAYGHYSYADYLSWQLDETIELIRGTVFKQAATAPRRLHQEISMVLSNKLPRLRVDIFDFIDSVELAAYHSAPTTCDPRHFPK